MKTRITNILFTTALAAMMTLSCKKSDSENTEAATEETTDMSATEAGDDTENSGGTAEGTEANNGSASDVSGAGEGSDSGNIEMSGDGSDGRTNSTSVNKSKKVQMGKKSNSKSGYSAPDGTAAENSDGDMYTKHDTTRMPSGSVPIK